MWSIFFRPSGPAAWAPTMPSMDSIAVATPDMRQFLTRLRMAFLSLVCGFTGIRDAMRKPISALMLQIVKREGGPAAAPLGTTDGRANRGASVPLQRQVDEIRNVVPGAVLVAEVDGSLDVDVGARRGLDDLGLRARGPGVLRRGDAHAQLLVGIARCLGPGDPVLAFARIHAVEAPGLGQQAEGRRL